MICYPIDHAMPFVCLEERKQKKLDTSELADIFLLFLSYILHDLTNLSKKKRKNIYDISIEF